MSSYDDYITCPYDASHQIRHCRIQYHLVKCQKVSSSLFNISLFSWKNYKNWWGRFFQNHPDRLMAICPYNASHHVPKEEEQQHLSDCPDRRIIEMQKFNDPLPGQHGCLTNPSFYGSSLIPTMAQAGEENESLLRLNDTMNSSINASERHHDLRSRLDCRGTRKTSSRYTKKLGHMQC
jgi:hypothetical protein